MKEIFKLFFIALLCLLMPTACGKTDAGDSAFEPLHTSYKEILAYSGSNYDEPIKKIESLQMEIRTYLNRFPKSEKRTEAERILSETKNMQLELQREQFDFSELEKRFKQRHTIDEVDLEINDIKAFLRNYPQSIKSNDLKNRIESLVFEKFQLETTVTPQTISDINRTIQTAKGYLGQLRNANFKAQVNDKIKKVEARRQSIYEMEFQLQVAELFKQMDAQVVKIARDSHPASKIESVNVSIVSGDVSKAAPQVKVVREYIVNMRGAIMGINRYQLKIQVSGVLLGTNQTGVSYNIAGATKVSDYRI
ncbi:MAG: hypothetical protein GTN82_12495 [Candidatus Aminicenantes bacterium]|nr:hypothetical protein [Candidatus Aminicenantes bacterium]